MTDPSKGSPLPQKLVAVLHADVAGFSRLTHADERGTHQAWRAAVDAVSSLIDGFYGRLVNRAGDELLAEFDSVSNALTCAVAIHRELAERSRDLPAERQIKLRVGINLGEVIVDRGELYGDGVNIAARLTALAEPGGVVVSEAIHDAIGTKLPLQFKSLGEQQVKNIARPVRAYRATAPAGVDMPPPQPPQIVTPTKSRPRRGTILAFVVLAVMAVGLVTWLRPWTTLDPSPPAKPTIAVLPFKNLSGDAKQEYFSDGISEDVITDLSRLSSVKVLARNTTFAYKGRSVDAQQIGKELGVQYVLEGGIQKTNDRVRISVQLVNARDGFHVWGERYDRNLADVFKLQDEITNSIVSALLVKLTGEERTLLAQKSTQNFEAYNLFLQGLEHNRHSSPQDLVAANDYYRRAIELDPSFGRAYGSYAINLIRQKEVGWAENPNENQELALKYALKGVELNPLLPQTNWALGFVYNGIKRYDDAIDVATELVRRFPHYADGLGLLAYIKNRVGDAQEAIDLIHRAMDLNPSYSWDYPWNLGMAYYTLKRYEEAVRYLKQALTRNEFPINPNLILIASYVQLGRLDDAQWEATRLTTTNPNMTLTHLANSSHLYKDRDKMLELIAVLRKAGIPE